MLNTRQTANKFYLCIDTVQGKQRNLDVIKLLCEEVEGF